MKTTLSINTDLDVMKLIIYYKNNTQACLPTDILLHKWVS